ncbi:MAG: DMT family transporter [Treponema sp.]|nr:DMT family transporter [Treponema sp.]
MEKLGAFAAFGTAVFWTASAIAFEGASKRVGVLAVNFWKVTMAFVLLALAALATGGEFLPFGASARSWTFLTISGLIGFVIADYFLFNAYVLIGSRVTVVFQALTPLFAAAFGYVLLGESMRLGALVGMATVVSGIVILVMARNAAVARARGEGGGDRARGAGQVSGPIEARAAEGGAAEGGAIEARRRKDVQLRGYVFAFLSTVFQALGLVTSKLGLSGIEAIPATQIRVLAAMVGFAIQTLILRRSDEVFARPFREGRVALRIGLGSVVGPFLGVTLSLYALQHTDVGTASTLMALTPVLIIPPAIVFMRQKVSAMEIVGAIIAVGGTSLFFLV